MMESHQKLELKKNLFFQKKMEALRCNFCIILLIISSLKSFLMEFILKSELKKKSFKFFLHFCSQYLINRNLPYNFTSFFMKLLPISKK